MKEYLDRVEKLLTDVQNEELDYSEGELEELAAEGTLGNIGTYLAVYQGDENIEVDHELLESLDQVQTQKAREKAKAPSGCRKN